jgi:hypothetical protein
MQNGDAVRELVTAQMTLIEDVRLVAVIRELLVDPYPVVREWDYGAQETQTSAGPYSNIESQIAASLTENSVSE